MNLELEPNIRVLQLREAHLPRTAELLARALESDAAYAYLLPDPKTRGAGLRDFFRGNLRTHLPHACTFVALDDHDRAIATVTLRSSTTIEISLWTILRHGLLPFAFRHGSDAVRRLFWLKRTYDALEAEAAANEPHAHVHMMAVDPEHQGRGLGSRLLARLLATYEAPAATLQTVLTTHLERNVVFYERHGFEVLSQRTLHPPDGHSYTVWSMRRAATPRAD